MGTFSCLSGEKEGGGFARPEKKEPSHKTIETLASSITSTCLRSGLISVNKEISLCDFICPPNHVSLVALMLMSLYDLSCILIAS